MKERIRFAGVEKRMLNRKRGFAYKTAGSIVNGYKEIYVEGLRIGKLARNRKVSSAQEAPVADAEEWFDLVAERSDGRIALLDPRNTSQLCSGFESNVEKALSERMHRCLVWGHVRMGLNDSWDVYRPLESLEIEVGLSLGGTLEWMWGLRGGGLRWVGCGSGGMRHGLGSPVTVGGEM